MDTYRLKERKKDPAVIQRAFALALGRSASADELSACLERWSQATQAEQKKVPQPKIYHKKIKRTVLSNFDILKKYKAVLINFYFFFV